MSAEKIYPVSKAVADSAHIDAAAYEQMYQYSVKQPESFWAEQAEQFLSWYSSWDRVLDWDYKKAHIRWFEGATLNVCYNCVDRHLETKANDIAILWEGDDPAEDRAITYAELHTEV